MNLYFVLMFLILTLWQIESNYLTHRISDESATGQETCAYVRPAPMLLLDIPDNKAALTIASVMFPF